LKRVCRRADRRHLQIMYGVDGRRDLPEVLLEHLAGYGGAHPVRVGNGAAGQFQLDVYGEILETTDIWRRTHAITEGLWKVLRDLVEWTAGHWRELASSCEELIYRYRSPDGLQGTEGAFLFCSFWMVQSLAMIGEVAEADRLFRNLVRRANHVGLLAEEIEPATGAQLGNFPQALSHAALINTACLLES